MHEEKIEGKCKWFHIERGYGFITGSNGMEYFVHYSNIQGDGFKKIEEGQEVVFQPAKNCRGNYASAVECKKGD